MKHVVLVIASIVISSTSAVNVQAQNGKTKYEQYAKTTNELQMHSHTSFDKIKGEYGSTLSMEASQLTPINKPSDRHQGVRLAVSEPSKSLVAFIDSDEVDGIIAFIDAVGRPSANSTGFGGSTIEYRTRGGLEFSGQFDASDPIKASFNVVIVEGATSTWISMKPEQVAQFKNNLIAIKSLFK